eukprot:3136898-Alexandrium_andersonii.AAC.1
MAPSSASGAARETHPRRLGKPARATEAWGAHRKQMDPTGAAGRINAASKARVRAQTRRYRVEGAPGPADQP